MRARVLTQDAERGSTLLPVSAPVDVVIVAAGGGNRLGADIPKAFIEVGGVPLLSMALGGAASIGPRRIAVAVPPRDPDPWVDRVHELATGLQVTPVPGGSSRQASVFEALKALRDSAAEAGEAAPGYVLVHDAARPCASAELWRRVADATRDFGAAIPVLPAVDSLKRLGPGGEVAGTVDRSAIVRAQTPQGFRFDWLYEAHAAAADEPLATDDAALVERLGRTVATVEGEDANIKVTTRADLRLLASLLGSAAPAVRVGYGYDIHPLVEGRRLVLGGVTIEHDRGLDGHSDADALAHAVTDALLGAAGMGDIGQKFPADDDRWAGADSITLLASVVEDLRAGGFRLGSVDATILAEEPRLDAHLAAMRERLAGALAIPASAVNVKATRGEGLGHIGRGEGIAAHAVAVIVRA